MELEQCLSHLNCYDTVLDTTLTREETMEFIVPDACPDIFRVVDTSCTPFLGNKETQDGRAVLSGTARVSVLYEPDGEGGPCCLDLNVPWTSTLDRGDIHPNSKITAIPRVLGAETRLLNPRKVLVRVELALALRIYAPQTSDICCGVNCGEETGVQQQKKAYKNYMVSNVQEKNFTFSDDLAISGNKPPAEKILRQRAEIVPGEARIIGTKLILKGEIHLVILYQAKDNNPSSAHFELPYSQIMDAQGTGEEAVPTVDLLMNDMTCGLSDGEGRTISVTLSLMAQAVIREERAVEVLSDLYSILYDIKATRSVLDLNTKAGSGVLHQAVREIAEVPENVSSVVDLEARVGRTNVSREGNELVVSAEACVNALCMGDDGQMNSVKRTFPVTTRLEAEDADNLVVDPQISGENIATPASNGIEFRLGLDFRYLLLKPQQVACASNPVLDEKAPRDTMGKPSVVLRSVARGETLWEIARDYATTMNDIMQANGMEEDEPLGGQLLLIPKKR